MTKVYQCPDCDKELADWEMTEAADEGEALQCPNCGGELKEIWNVA